ncbi:hypothetical protein C8J57DRAFT_1221366 [Mycena rebaudengoi]|nr:hypothetical protein C8J57DRAFT_1221366 [Mycena rebaudengoi]
MLMTAGPATCATITGGSSAPPTRQAPSPAPHKPAEEIDQPEFAGQQLTTHRRGTSSDQSEWWRAVSPGPETMRDVAEAAEMRRELADETVRTAIPRLRMVHRRQGRRERERIKKSKQELQLGKAQHPGRSRAPRDVGQSQSGGRGGGRQRKGWSEHRQRGQGRRRWRRGRC